MAAPVLIPTRARYLQQGEAERGFGIELAY